MQSKHGQIKDNRLKQIRSAPERQQVNPLFLVP